MMTTQNNNPQTNNSQNNNPNQKGLGWIPDYPDLRDYRLGSGDINTKEGRLKREEGSKQIEQIAQNLTTFVESFSDFLDMFARLQPDSNMDRGENKSEAANASLIDEIKELKRIAGDQIIDIKSKIFGDISFESVNIYRRLRLGINTISPFSSEDYWYESDVTKRIFELKSCLHAIFREMPELAEILKNDNDPFQENLLPEKQRVVKREQSDVKESLRMLTQPFEVIKWLREDDQDRKNSFDQHTDRLVRLFQHCSNIWRDGIVGLETYTTLSDYLKHFSEPDNQDIKDFKERFISFFHPLSQEEKLYSNSVEDSDKYKLRAYHLPVSLLLSEAVFRKILNQMEAWFASEIQSQDSSQLFEQEHLEKLKVSQPNIFEDLIQQKIGSQKLETNKCVKRLSASFFKDEKNKDIFIEILQKEFLLVEPIVAVVIKILTPLAFFRQDPLEDVVAEGLRRFEHLLTEKNEDKQQQFLRKSLLGEKGLEQSEVEKVTKKFALMALQQAQSIFDGEIKFKIQEYEKFRCQANHESQWRSEATLYFYLLVKKVIRHFLRINDHPNIDQPILPNNKALNPFEKQEILEINRSAHLEEIKIFNIPQLQIPFRTTYLESFSFNACQPDSLKQYLFLPGVVDLSYWCPEIEDQGSLNTCTAFAGVALLEYFMNRSTGRHTDVSPLFLYKATRNLMNLQGDVGASVRETMKAMALFGIPPEQYWQYDETKVDEEPPSFCYSFAQHFQALKYFRLDYAGILKEVLLIQIKAVIATGFPCIFGFTIYTSAYEAANQQNGWIPFPNEKTDRVVGGHSVVAVGYDDYKEIDRKDRNFPSTGAFLIRNSFGADWGLEGYGWLPYDYVLAGLTADWWSLLKAEWFADDFWQGARGSQGSEQNEFRQG